MILGAIPGLPKVHLHNPVLAYENGDDFMKFFYQAEEGRLDPFVLVVEGSSPTKRSKRKATGRRWAPTRLPVSRSRPANGSTVSRPRRWLLLLPEPAQPTAASTPWRATPRAPWAWPIISAGTGARSWRFPIVNVPGCPVQPDNLMETLLYLLYQAAGWPP